MKKVLILSGSPRKNGNSDILCDEFMKGAVEAGNEVERFVLRKRTSDTAVRVMPAAVPVYAPSRTIWQRFCRK